MSSDSIKVIREAEKAAEAAEKKAKEEANQIVQAAHEKAKEWIAAKTNEAKAKAESSLSDQEASNEAFMKKAETEITKEVAKLRSAAEAKKKGVVADVNNFLF